ncbi:hypothetical protein HOD20_05635 [archaeon]|mgnify:CR=1|jgi:uncharacterized protein (UPF0332 family)|nr:hypothetical protein [archaeon]MBT4351985.1 hypothetical protein [archaeon]MBT4647732.1 hypothetical protein [archaeon]MBT6821260.1 hypothetical protein [archaeon]
MIDNKEIEIIRKKFQRLVLENRIKNPKIHKKEFFLKKAFSSIQLAKKLVNENEYLDWVINVSYYSMFYNAVALLAYIDVDLGDIDESVHILTYQAIVYYFFILNKKIEEQYIDDFKKEMEQADKRIKNLARQRSNEIISSFKNARKKRAEITYELGKTAEIKSAQTSLRRAESFDILVNRIMID